MSEPLELTDDAPVYVISIAAQISGLHAQTLRQYDRLGLVSPGPHPRRRPSLLAARHRPAPRGRSACPNQGVNLEGIRRVLALEGEVDRLRRRIAQLESEHRSGALVVWRPDRRR